MKPERYPKIQMLSIYHPFDVTDTILHALTPNGISGVNVDVGKVSRASVIHEIFHLAYDLVSRTIEFFVTKVVVERNFFNHIPIFGDEFDSRTSVLHQSVTVRRNAEVVKINLNQCSSPL